MNLTFIHNKFVYKNKNFFDLKKKLFTENTNFVILNGGYWEGLQLITFFNLNIYELNILDIRNISNVITIINSYKNFNYNVGINEYDLKGVNYRFSLFKNILFLDLGKSHFQLVIFYFNKFFLKLKKKWLKWLVFISFNKLKHNFITDFFWFKLKKIGPYKLKGFQFINEWIKLKEGKKPFK